ncbi:MAG TPA: DUF3137 domain-containing protein [Bacteroidia bacterium]|jgi:hypothetical protein|nr:DUF3137 domain-containing protein [Bacteroidia bacterium]
MSAQRTYFSLFTEEEQEKLHKLEKQRIILRRKPALWIIASTLFLAVMGIMGGVIEMAEYGNSVWPYVIMLVAVLGFFGFVAWITFKFPDRDSLSYKYKRMMLRRVVPHILPGWVFASSHRLMNEDIRKSGLFRDKANRIAREDYLFGPAGKVVAEVYQITLQSESSSNRDPRTGAVIQREIPTNHFYGYFYRVHCPVIFPCEVWVFPKKKKASGETDEWALLTDQKYSKAHHIAKFESGDPDFDSRFNVYTTDPKLATRIISENRRKSLAEMDRLYASAIAVSYTENKVYVMVGYADDPLDIHLKNEIGEKLLKEHADELSRMKDVALLAVGDLFR